jgi:hypothetical protein
MERLSNRGILAIPGGTSGPRTTKEKGIVGDKKRLRVADGSVLDRYLNAT